MESKLNTRKSPCPRCDSSLWLVPTEFGFHVPHCYICGFEDYSRTTRHPGLPAKDSSQNNVIEIKTHIADAA